VTCTQSQSLQLSPQKPPLNLTCTIASLPFAVARAIRLKNNNEQRQPATGFSIAAVVLLKVRKWIIRRFCRYVAIIHGRAYFRFCATISTRITLEYSKPCPHILNKDEYFHICKGGFADNTTFSRIEPVPKYLNFDLAHLCLCLTIMDAYRFILPFIFKPVNSAF